MNTAQTEVGLINVVLLINTIIVVVVVVADGGIVISISISAVRIVVFHFESNQIVDRIVFVVLKPTIFRHFRRLV